jgi:hypothetical protein
MFLQRRPTRSANTCTGKAVRMRQELLDIEYVGRGVSSYNVISVGHVLPMMSLLRWPLMPKSMKIGIQIYTPCSDVVASSHPC